jgi:acyl-CoA thioesterase YciA
MKMMKYLTRKIVMTKDIGVHGNLFGGMLMSWIDEAAAGYVTEYCFTPNMVTVHVGEFTFKKPLKAGQHVRIYGMVTHLGTSSISLDIEARKYNVYSGNETVVCTTTMTFVRIDDDGTPTPVGESIRKRHHELRAMNDPGGVAVA